MLNLKLETPVKIGETEVSELNFDFQKLRGSDMIAAERLARLENPRMINPVGDFAFLTQVAAKAGKVPDYVLKDLPGEIYMGIIGHTALFCNGSMAAKGLKNTMNSPKTSVKSAME